MCLGIYGAVCPSSIDTWKTQLLQWSCVTLNPVKPPFSSVFEFLGCCSISQSGVSTSQPSRVVDVISFLQNSTNCAISRSCRRTLMEASATGHNVMVNLRYNGDLYTLHSNVVALFLCQNSPVSFPLPLPHLGNNKSHNHCPDDDGQYSQGQR